MSSLDRAFIKAFTKERRRPVVQPQQGFSPWENAVRDAAANSQASDHTGQAARAATLRTDPPHTHSSMPPQPHFAPVQPADDPSDTPEGRPAKPPEEPAADPAALAEPAADNQESAVDEYKLQDEIETDAAQFHETLESAAALTVPPVLELPSVFAPEESTSPLPKDEDELSPDWEVDQFVWPEICSQLLASEAKYFEHVGRRLAAATTESQQVLMVSGSRRGEGRTTLALCLARCAASAGVKVALLDADLQNPQLAARLGVETPCGWLDVLQQKSPLNEAAIASVDDGVTLFPLSGEGTGGVQLDDERVVALLERISANYPLVIIDSSPLSAEQLHPFVRYKRNPIDAAIIVRDLRYTTAKKAITTAEQLIDSGVEAVGIAENFRAA